MPWLTPSRETTEHARTDLACIPSRLVNPHLIRPITRIPGLGRAAQRSGPEWMVMRAPKGRQGQAPAL